MRVERVSSAIRLELRPGEWVLWQARPFRFVSLHGSAARIRDTVTAELRDGPVADLRGMPTLPSEEFDRRLDRLRTTADSGWKLAQQRESIIRDLLYADGPMAEHDPWRAGHDACLDEDAGANDLGDNECSRRNERQSPDEG